MHVTSLVPGCVCAECRPRQAKLHAIQVWLQHSTICNKHGRQACTTKQYATNFDRTTCNKTGCRSCKFKQPTTNFYCMSCNKTGCRSCKIKQYANDSTADRARFDNMQHLWLQIMPDMLRCAIPNLCYVVRLWLQIMQDAEARLPPEPVGNDSTSCRIAVRLPTGTLDANWGNVC